jgi:hypothetical protein
MIVRAINAQEMVSHNGRCVVSSKNAKIHGSADFAPNYPKEEYQILFLSTLKPRLYLQPRSSAIPTTPWRVVCLLPTLRVGPIDRTLFERVNASTTAHFLTLSSLYWLENGRKYLGD